jgi:ferric-dicitrate binding protein FerR (iron transport regulator)
MRSPACFSTESLLYGRRAGLSEVERLALEEHLGACARCSLHAKKLDAILDLADSMPQALGAHARERAIAQVLAATPPSRAEFRSARRPWLFGVAAAAAVAIAVVAASLPADEQSRMPSEPVASAKPIEVEAAEVKRPASPAVFVSERGERVELAHAIVDLSPGTRLEWNEVEQTIHLEQGRLEVDVDPVPKRSFRVVTRRFVVLVLGTRFSVDERGVEVERGLVRVTDLGGEILADVGANERWPKPEARARVDAKPKRTKPAAPPEPTDPRAHLAKARLELAARVIDRAREEIDRAMSSPLSRADRAEAQTLLAECALADGERETALRMLREVASEYEDLVAGENALFAAARLQGEGSDPRSARRLLERYLERYPSGRFEGEVRRRLDRLPRE